VAVSLNLKSDEVTYNPVFLVVEKVVEATPLTECCRKIESISSREEG
jgi:hypothetical protein